MGDLRSGPGGTSDEGPPEPNRNEPGRGGEPASGPRVPAEPLTGFPADWGRIIIPDDAAELDRDLAVLLREQRRRTRQARLRTLVGRPPGGSSTQSGIAADRPSGPRVAMPMLIMSVAVLVTLVSLFVVTWARGPGGGPANRSTSLTSAAVADSTEFADISLTDGVGAPARLRTFLPAVVLLVDGCDCEQLVTDLARSAPAGVTVAPVARTLPQLHTSPANVRPLADPNAALTSRVGAAAPGTATAVLLDPAGAISATVRGVHSAKDLTPEQLAHLATH